MSDQAAPAVLHSWPTRCAPLVRSARGNCAAHLHPSLVQRYTTPSNKSPLCQFFKLLHSRNCRPKDGGPLLPTTAPMLSNDGPVTKHPVVDRDACVALLAEERSSAYSVDAHHRGVTRVVNTEEWRKIRALDLSFNALAAIENLDPLVELRELKLYSNEIAEIEGLGFCRKLETLELHQNRIERMPPHLTALVALKTLRLDCNRIVTVENLHACRKLELLDLSRNRLAAEQPGFKALATLTTLNLSSNELGAVPPLRDCRSLTELDLSHNRIASALKGLRGVAKLASLNLAHNRLGSLDALPALPKLEELNLRANALRAVGPAVALFPLLDVLDVSANQLADAMDLGSLAAHPALRDLAIAGNPATDGAADPAGYALLRKKFTELSHLDGAEFDAAAEVPFAAAPPRPPTASSTGRPLTASRRPLTASRRPGTSGGGGAAAQRRPGTSGAGKGSPRGAIPLVRPPTRAGTEVAVLSSGAMEGRVAALKARMAGFRAACDDLGGATRAAEEGSKVERDARAERAEAKEARRREEAGAAAEAKEAKEAGAGEEAAEAKKTAAPPAGAPSPAQPSRRSRFNRKAAARKAHTAVEDKEGEGERAAAEAPPSAIAAAAEAKEAEPEGDGAEGGPRRGSNAGRRGDIASARDFSRQQQRDEQEQEKENSAPKRHGVPALAMGPLGLDLRLHNRHPAFLTTAEGEDEIFGGGGGGDTRRSVDGGGDDSSAADAKAQPPEEPDWALVSPRFVPEKTAERRGKPTAKETAGYRGFRVPKKAKALLATREQQAKTPRQPQAAAQDAKE